LEIARLRGDPPARIPRCSTNPLRGSAARTDDLKALIGVLRDPAQRHRIAYRSDMRLVMSISDPIYVISQGTPWRTVRRSRSARTRTIKAYLGKCCDDDVSTFYGKIQALHDVLLKCVGVRS
jgi:hypothetical protein